ncbi:hypothetical protein K474DRAFT_1633060 [Panus rudis PR-1116 ss-1]|nr:hypothetical protein K474DRAFT_1633060 [Panus rudis PR-1116 ss-1]
MAKKRCQFQASSEDRCKEAVLRLVGQCPHCRQEYCGTHRMPEHHACTNLESCRQQAFDKNKAKLEAERTTTSKMAMV